MGKPLFNRLYVSYGRGLLRDVDREFVLIWLDKDWEETRKEGYMLPGIHFRMSWNWLPRFDWASFVLKGWYEPGVTFSERWTGRDKEIYRIFWPFGFWLTRVRAADLV